VEKEAGKPKVREIKAKEMDVTVELRYQLDPAVGRSARGVSSFITQQKQSAFSKKVIAQFYTSGPLIIGRAFVCFNTLPFDPGRF